MEDFPMNPTKNTLKNEKIDAIRMKDIICQLADVIYLLCKVRKINISTVLDQFTNITKEEQERLNLIFSNEMEDQ